jgi:expansin (peptidoglycan-binding protein)
VQVRNHRHGVSRFEVMVDGAFVDVPRLDYNFFVRDAGMGEGPFVFRVTDVHGHVVEDSGITLLDDGTSSGSSQFPACAD